MERQRHYILFVMVVLALQCLLLNHLTISTLFAPMVYVAILIVMPLDSSQLKMLITALLLGAFIDVTMGTVGLNVLATLPVAMLRRPMLRHVANLSDYALANDIPTIKLLGVRRFYTYIAAMVVLHSLIFFTMEQLSFFNFWYFVLRLVICTLSSVLLVMVLLRLFNTRFEAK